MAAVSPPTIIVSDSRQILYVVLTLMLRVTSFYHAHIHFKNSCVGLQWTCLVKGAGSNVIHVNGRTETKRTETRNLKTDEQQTGPQLNVKMTEMQRGDKETHD